MRMAENASKEERAEQITEPAAGKGEAEGPRIALEGPAEATRAHDAPRLARDSPPTAEDLKQREGYEAMNF